jgi:hypothetical protein
MTVDGWELDIPMFLMVRFPPRLVIMRNLTLVVAACGV